MQQEQIVDAIMRLLVKVEKAADEGKVPVAVVYLDLIKLYIDFASVSANKKPEETE